jgi:hypothetical protein
LQWLGLWLWLLFVLLRQQFDPLHRLMGPLCVQIA